MAAPPAPLPPQIEQQQDPQGAQSAFMAQGVGQPQPGMQAVQQVVAKIKEVAIGLDDLRTQLQQIHPPLVATMEPIKQALTQLLQGLNQVAQRSGMAQGSPVISSPPQGAGNPGANPPNPLGQ